MSHEQLKSPHEVLGRIIFLLFVLHAIFYINFFVLSDLFAKRSTDKDVALGLASIKLFAVLSTTALGVLRRWSYRLFYISHVAIANIVVITLFFHVSHIRPYMWGVIVINGIHLIFRSQALRKYSGSIKVLPGTNLVEVRIPLQPGDPALKWKHGQHVYLSRPTGKPYSNSSVRDQFILRNQTNPFSIASLPSVDHELLLVARTLKGNTRKIAELAKALPEDAASSIPLAIEGPYGHSSYLPDFARFDKILLVAGGVGATYVMPLYRTILAAHTGSNTEVRFIWSVRKLSETYWAFSPTEDRASFADQNSPVEVYVTQPSGPDLHSNGGASDEIELSEDQHLLSLEEQMEKPREGMVVKAGRPKMDGIVDEVFSKGERVAVFVCGPVGLTESTSRLVEEWVNRGVEVYWHDETFGW